MQDEVVIVTEMWLLSMDLLISPMIGMLIPSWLTLVLWRGCGVMAPLDLAHDQDVDPQLVDLMRQDIAGVALPHQVLVRNLRGQSDTTGVFFRHVPKTRGSGAEAHPERVALLVDAARQVVGLLLDLATSERGHSSWT